MASTPYLYLPQGHGGIFDLPFSNTPHTTSIGTYKCRTCVCVYIPLSDSQCFAAHIDAHVKIRAGKEDEDWVPSPEQAATLKAFLRQQLHSLMPQFASGEYGTNSLRSRAVIVCPRRRVYLNGTEHRATGSFVIEQIREFFRLDDQGTDAVTEDAHGFVVDHKTGKLEYLKYKGMSLEQLDRKHKLESIAGGDIGDDDSDDLARLIAAEKLVSHGTAAEFGYHDVRTTSPRRQWSFCYDEKKGWKLLEFGDLEFEKNGPKTSAS